ncbi:single-stranded DNA-binding protein [Elizabethkingia anophelis]|uniref:Single-stranded DNA-binding protein n=2 Tax=Elizabethkingia anophelis TaxID=1117645 RepID=A0A455ZFK2_9FLAO|nr:single-stranded DNA-binding protein [Elizabethkingia anophelis]ATC35567.1 single-strand-binding protein [Elizabethkingia anophelis R26]ATC39205.1 single-strand-binding protein [Elizabethkingia anophelis Ag1]ATC42886.1 single-strand-binding protein [Elizabethkingia anophelis]ATC46562.1 single-strand-binding protein [Elizabethkingia anophelis]ELR78610.1 ssDNA-binding protein [Elizabethkingia anophelis R26]
MEKTNRIYLSGEIIADVDFSCESCAIAWVKLETIDSFVDEAGEEYSTVQDHNLVAVGNIAEIFKNFLLKGMKIQVWGKLAYHSYKEGDKDLRHVSIHVEKVKY